MPKKTSSGNPAGTAAEAVARVAPDLLVNILIPSLDEVSRRAHGLLDHAEEAVDKAGESLLRKTRVAGSELSDRAYKTIDRAKDRAVRATDHVNLSLAERLEQASDHLKVLLDSFMDRVLALVLAVTVGYGAYFIAHARGGEINVGRLAALVWMGMTLFSLVIWVGWSLSGRPQRLKHILVWFLYIVALGGIGALVLAGISRWAPV